MHELATRLIHEAEIPDANTGALTPHIVPSAPFRIDSERGVAFSILDRAEDDPYAYSRWSNPTVRLLERKVAALENAEEAVAFGSGMAAATGLLLHLLRERDHLVAANVCYAGVAEFVRDTLPSYGVTVTLFDPSDPNELVSALRDDTRLVYLETPANPTLQIADIRALADQAHGAGVPLAVDSTIATPVATRPLDLGADFVIHSLTKYLNGHGDAIGGIVCGPRETMANVRADVGVHLGATLGPFEAWLILRGLRTLGLRVAAQSEGAARVAEFLANHPRVEGVNYPGLRSHPQHDVARRQMDVFGGLLSFRLRGDSAAWARTLTQSLELFTYAMSLGEQRSLIFYIPTDTILRSSFRLEGMALDRYRAIAGEGLFRISVGTEDPGDLCRDLGSALDQA